MIMENVSTEFFDLPALLKQGDLNTRKFSESERSVTVGEYFGALSELLTLEQDVDTALSKFADCNGEIADYRNLDSMIKILNKAGCSMFVIDFHSLLDAYGKKGNWREAAFHAKQIQKDFAGFCSRIKGSKLRAKPSGLADVSLSLNAYIAQLDEEDANRKPFILAVDDSPVILTSVASVLSNDYKVFTLTKPTELEKVLQKLTPELFIVDYQMPELSGFDLIPIIRGFPEHKDTPVVFLTSEGTFDNVTAALALGASDFIVKPFNPDVLRAKIAKYIVKRKLF